MSLHAATHADFLGDLRNTMRSVASGGGLPVVHDPERIALARPAPNAIQWCIGKEWCDSPSLIENFDEFGRPEPGYWKSYEIVRDTFQLRCPICNHGTPNCWGKTRTQLEDELLLEWSADLTDDVCPKCRITRQEFETDGMLRRINSMHLVCGQRSGKSVTVGLIGTYVEHRIITLGLSYPGGLRAYFGLTLNDPFEMTFLASNETQSLDTIWAKYRAFRRDSPWFKRAAEWFSTQQKNQLTPPGMQKWVYSESTAEIHNGHPDIFLIANSLNSNSAGLRGRTRVFGGIDEISHMLDGDSRMSADECYRAIDHSLSTVRSRATRRKQQRLSWLGLMASATSPRARDDKGMRLLKEMEGIRSALAYHLSTFEFNPYERYETYADLRTRDPVGFDRDYMAQPPAASHPLVMDWPRFLSGVVDHDLVPTAEFDYPRRKLDGHNYIGLRMQDARLDLSYGRHIAFDAGLNFDAFAGACAHGEVQIDQDTGVQRIVTVFDWIIRILPPPGCEVYFDDVFATMQAFSQKQPIVGIEFDHWQAKQLIQQVRRLGVVAQEVSIKGDDYRRFRADVYNGLVRMFAPDPRDYDHTRKPDERWVKDPAFMQAHSCALYELEMLEEDPDTQKVWNPHKGKVRGWNSNDVAEVVVHAHKMVQDSGYTKKHDERSREAARKRSEGDSVSWDAGGGGSVYNPGFGGSAMPNAPAGSGYYGGGLGQGGGTRGNGGGRGW